MISLIQLIVVLVAVVAVIKAIANYNKKRMALLSLILWCAIWIGAVIVIFIPKVSFFFANILGIGRGADFVVYVSIIILFYLMFRIYVKIDNVEKNVTKIVRETAIKKAKKKK